MRGRDRLALSWAFTGGPPAGFIPTPGRKRWDAPWQRERAQQGVGSALPPVAPTTGQNAKGTRRASMTRATGATGIRLLRRSLVLPLVAAIVLTLLVPYGAQAVHDAGVFQLDGDASSATQPPAPYPQATDDWDKVCNQVTGGGVSGCGTTLVTSRATAV